jgi:hypothetical protein
LPADVQLVRRQESFTRPAPRWTILCR